MNASEQDEKLTDDEHTARAMLLGREYAYIMHVYFKVDDFNTPYLDADTLQPLNPGEAHARFNKWNETNGR